MLTEHGYSTQVLLEKDAGQKMFREEGALNGILQKYGISVRYAPSRDQGRKGLVRYTLLIRFPEGMNARGAVRKPRECGIGMEEAMLMEEQGRAKKEIARLMGVSPATCYRKRKAFLAGQSGDAPRSASPSNRHRDN